MNGKAHTTISLALTAPCAILGAVAGGGIGGLGAGLGCFASVAINPDLDQESINYMEWRIIKRTFGLGFLWVAFWWLYARACKHRGVSHWPMIGTLTRALYVGVAALIVALASGVDLSAVPVWAWEFIAWGITGLAISDAAHWLMDML